MNSQEVVKVAEIIAGSLIGLAATYNAGRLILEKIFKPGTLKVPSHRLDNEICSGSGNRVLPFFSSAVKSRDANKMVECNACGTQLIGE